MPITIRCESCGYTTDIEITSDTNPIRCPACGGELRDAGTGNSWDGETLIAHALCLGDMVVGVGPTEDAAREDAVRAGVDLASAVDVEYDAIHREPRLHGGIVCLCDRD